MRDKAYAHHAAESIMYRRENNKKPLKNWEMSWELFLSLAYSRFNLLREITEMEITKAEDLL